MTQAEAKQYYKFFGYTLVKWTGIYAFLFRGRRMDWEALLVPRNLLAFLVMFLLMPALEMVLLYPVFRRAISKHGEARVLLLMAAFSGELLLVCGLTANTPSLWALGLVGYSVGLYLLFYRRMLCPLQ
jgi:hypothetical protein